VEKDDVKVETTEVIIKIEVKKEEEIETKDESYLNNSIQDADDDGLSEYKPIALRKSTRSSVKKQQELKQQTPVKTVQLQTPIKSAKKTTLPKAKPKSKKELFRQDESEVEESSSSDEDQTPPSKSKKVRSTF
jgi:hypothetical protein